MIMAARKDSKMMTPAASTSVLPRSWSLFVPLWVLLVVLLLPHPVPASRIQARSADSQIGFGKSGRYSFLAGVQMDSRPHEAASIASASRSGTDERENIHDLPLESPPEEDRACSKVCCWQANPHCPYPYCNYNEPPCGMEAEQGAN